MTLEADIDFDIKYGIIDTVTPPNAELSALYKKSFAYYTFRFRLPSTLQSIIDGLVNGKDDLIKIYGEETAVDVEACVNAVTQLRADILNDGQLAAFDENIATESDTALWNAFIEKLDSQKKSYFKACWLYAECYMYRKISSIFKATKNLAEYDYFSKQKETAALLSTSAMEAVALATRNIERNQTTFEKLLKLSLWGNRCDLSITSGKQVKPTGDAFEQITALDQKLLIDTSNKIWGALEKVKSTEPVVVEIVCDNAGYELYTDLILAEFIIDKGLAQKVRFNVKAIPWFISDVTASDYDWTLDFLHEQSSPVLKALGQKLKEFTIAGLFEVAPLEHFWTSPYEFYRMREINPDLYARLSAAQLIIFKGDLNYRKLIGDYSWKFTENFTTCLRGFQPSNLCTLRTVKADSICGLQPGVSEALFKKDAEWMLTGEYGIIQYDGID